MSNINHFRSITYMGKSLKLVAKGFVKGNPYIVKCRLFEAELCINFGLKYKFYKFSNNLTVEKALSMASYLAPEEAARKSFIEFLKLKYPSLLTLKVSSLADFLKLDSIHIVDILFTDAIKYYTYLTLADTSTFKENLISLLGEKYKKLHAQIALK